MRKNRGKILLNFLNRGSEAIGTYYSVLTCRRPPDHASYFAPREYEFSCSNTPMAIYRRPSFKRRRRLETEAAPPSPPQTEEDVDRDAEEFITTFYRELKKQNTRFAAAAWDSESEPEFGLRDPWTYPDDNIIPL